MTTTVGSLFICSHNKKQEGSSCQSNEYIGLIYIAVSCFTGIKKNISTRAPATIAPGVKRKVIAGTKPNPNPNPNPIPNYPIMKLKVNHYEDVKPFLSEISSLEQLPPEQMSHYQ